ncbi:hypothetical protein LOAG_01758 [Loa loa]|uniref:Uncharacterized protein n=1 Tax=Loa loa TaxID=7209 RepID=A0A1S0U875_LOALO|nr:hypothetical protein LOAG_01758 [Loa loa]EFO26726.2 hypothetical protein LOAG_01758 [Loa loa]
MVTSTQTHECVTSTRNKRMRRDEKHHNDQKSKNITVTPISIADWNGLQAVRCVAFYISVWWELKKAGNENLDLWCFNRGFTGFPESYLQGNREKSAA